MLLGRRARVISFVIAAVGSSYYAFSRNLFKDEPITNTPHKKLSVWNHNWDCEKSGLPSPTNTSKHFRKLIILVRHGQYDTKAPSRNGKVLTQLGWKQATLTGKRLRELGHK